MKTTHSHSIYKILLISICFYSFSSCKNTVDNDAVIEQKVEVLLSKMTLEEKIGQMSQVRHFADITDEDIATKFIGSVIHTQGPTPGKMPLDGKQDL